MKVFSRFRERHFAKNDALFRGLVEQGTLALHGWYFDIERGELLGYDATTRRFEAL